MNMIFLQLFKKYKVKHVECFKQLSPKHVLPLCNGIA